MCPRAEPRPSHCPGATRRLRLPGRPREWCRRRSTFRPATCARQAGEAAPARRSLRKRRRLAQREAASGSAAHSPSTCDSQCEKVEREWRGAGVVGEEPAGRSEEPCSLLARLDQQRRARARRACTTERLSNAHGERFGGFRTHRARTGRRAHSKILAMKHGESSGSSLQGRPGVEGELEIRYGTE